MTPAFTHCALHVANLDQSIAFYERYCGLKIVKEHGDGDKRVVWLASLGGEPDRYSQVPLNRGSCQRGFGLPR